MSQPHSAEYFGEQRDFWWNRDFLDLMATRWRLGEASSLADIGCGLCHWSRLLYPYLKQPARLAGVDRELRWVAEAERHFRRAFPDVPRDLLSFLSGEATDLPLPDDAFDVVTCQTVLMHMDRPKEALREMLRVVRPGGLLVCVEPNNFWNYIAFTSLSGGESVEILARRFEFWLRYLRGKLAAGQGDHNIGDLLPGLFAQAGLRDITVHLSDKAHAVFPPYDRPGQRALLQQDQQWKDSGTGPWDREQVHRAVRAGGGSDELFERVFAELIEKFDDEQRAIADGVFHSAFGALHYLVSGRKNVSEPRAD